MQKVQFFIAHGALIWMIALPILTVLAGLLVRWAWRRWSAYKVLRDVRRVSSQVRGFQLAGSTYLRGTLRGGTLMTCSGAGTQSTYLGEPWLECGGQRVDIDASHVRVAQGTRMTTQAWHPIWPRTDRSVVGGDEVIVGGILRRDERGWRLSPNSRHAAVPGHHEVYAAKPDQRSGAIGLLCAGLILGSIAATFYGVMHHVGAKARARLWRSEQRATETIDDLQDFEIAASMPGSSENLNEVLDDVLAYRFPHTEDTFQLRVEVQESRGECPFWLYFSFARYDEAVTVAERCGTRKQKLWAYSFDGRFADAEQQLGPDDAAFTAITAIALGHWEAAARVEDALADQNHDGTSTPMRCIAALFRSYGGDEHAFDRIPNPVGECAVVAALSLPPPQQAAALEGALANHDLPEVYQELGELVSAALPQGTYRSLDCCRFGDWIHELWFMPFIDRAHRADGDRAAVHDQVVVTARPS